MLIERKVVATYASHSVNQAGAVKVTMKAGYDQLEGSTNLLKMLQGNIEVKVKLLEKKPFILGVFKLASLSFDKNGVSTIKLESITDAIDSDRLQEIVTMDLMQVKFSCKVEDE